jgi:Leucine Rich Repeat (LRR) protein
MYYHRKLAVAFAGVAFVTYLTVQIGPTCRAEPTQEPAHIDSAAVKYSHPFPETIVTAWSKVAGVGWMFPDKFGELLYYDDPHGRERELPSFRVYEWEAGMIAKLPSPGTPFGLHLGGSGVDDAGLGEVAALKNLRLLSLYEDPVTPAGLKKLAALQNLLALDLERVGVENKDIEAIAGLKNLQLLNIALANVTDSGIKELAQLRELRVVDLSHAKITDAGLPPLAKLENLESLSLDGNKLTGLGLREFAGLRRLGVLHIGGTNVNDEGLCSACYVEELARA